MRLWDVKQQAPSIPVICVEDDPNDENRVYVTDVNRNHANMTLVDFYEYVVLADDCVILSSRVWHPATGKLGVEISELDPFGFDSWFAAAPPLKDRRQEELKLALRHAVALGDSLTTAAEATAGLRDLDVILCVIEFREPNSYKQIDGLEDLLLRLGRIAKRNPRGDNDTYGVVNPLDWRMRTITGLPAERLLIEGLHAGGTGLEDILRRLETIAINDNEADVIEAAAGLVEAWEPMVESAVLMARKMPLDVFSLELIPWLVPIEIGGTIWRAPTGAQFSNVGFDYALWGRDAARTDVRYAEYARALMAEMPEHHQHIIDRILTATGDRSLLSVLPERGYPQAVWVGLAEFVKRIRDFRSIHSRVAIETLEMRPGVKGSGMQDELLFGPLIAYTKEAYELLKAGT